METLRAYTYIYMNICRYACLKKHGYLKTSHFTLTIANYPVQICPTLIAKLVINQFFFSFSISIQCPTVFPHDLKYNVISTNYRNWLIKKCIKLVVWKSNQKHSISLGIWRLIFNNRKGVKYKKNFTIKFCD